jgi:hypothetical protein
VLAKVTVTSPVAVVDTPEIKVPEELTTLAVPL